ncbi:MAG: biopolymer transporter ExbD [Pontiellaceae bacterium]|nr:biopolymer transporter ExbD [Pontiellaceae bacterium]MBN2783742.1 biopolymer transporter ExbD [Pontiellaceae bacterium]
MNIKMPAREDAEVDMAPMIDLVFLLLIFFMVASIVTTEKVPVEIPKSDHAKVPNDIKNRIMVSIDADGNFYYGMNQLELEDLQEIISDELDQNENLRVLIRADYRVKYEECKKLMIACGEVGATDLIYAAFEE